jgi:hypothetical protein
MKNKGGMVNTMIAETVKNPVTTIFSLAVATALVAAPDILRSAGAQDNKASMPTPAKVEMSVPSRG